MCSGTNVSVSMCWNTSVGTSEICTLQQSSCTLFYGTLSTLYSNPNPNRDSKLWMTCLCMPFLKSSYSGAYFPLTKHGCRKLKYTSHILSRTCRAQNFFSRSSYHPPQIVSTPHTHAHIHTHQHLSHCTTLRWPLPKCGQNVPFTRAAGQSK